MTASWFWLEFYQIYVLETSLRFFIPRSHQVLCGNVDGLSPSRPFLSLTGFLVHIFVIYIFRFSSLFWLWIHLLLNGSFFPSSEFTTTNMLDKRIWTLWTKHLLKGCSSFAHIPQKGHRTFLAPIRSPRTLLFCLPVPVRCPRLCSSPV